MGALIPIVLQLVPELAHLFVGGAASSAIDKVGEIAQKVFGTKDATAIQAQMASDTNKVEAFKAQLAALATSDQAQNAVNAAEAANPSLFIAGWRPFIGWVCGLGLGYQYLLFPFLAWISSIIGVAPPPALDTNSLTSLVTGMLGLGVLRTYEKLRDADTTGIRAAVLPRAFGGQ